jgi:PKD repeat protein
VTVQFSDLSSLGAVPITTWAWNFGDGSVSGEQHPEHTYTVQGLYSVSLTVSGGGLQQTVAKTNLIEVLAPAEPEVRFSQQHGFFESPFSLTLTTETPGAVIRYTLDGTAPTESTGTIYTTPIAISTTAVVRAGAFATGLVTSRVQTQSYLFLDDVITQSADGSTPAGWPTGVVNQQIMDYQMDPEVTQDPRYSSQMKDSLLSVQTISIVTDVNNFVEPTTGFYVNANRRGRDWERPISMELLDPEGGDTFQVQAGIRVRGGWSRRGDNGKHAFRLYFRAEYGDPQLNFPMFGDEGADSFDKLDLRTSTDYSWSLGDEDGEGLGGLNTMTRDVFSRDTQRDMGQPYTRSRYYHVYINGLYWGVFQSQERSEEEYAETYFGGDSADYDVIKRNSEEVAGDGVAWTALWNAYIAGFDTDEKYYKVLGKNADGTPNPAYPILVNPENLISYMLVAYYGGNFDAPISWWYEDDNDITIRNTGANNIWAIYNRVHPNGFVYFSHDSEHTLLAHLAGELPFPQIDASVDRTGPFLHPDLNQYKYNNPQSLHQALTAHPEYRMVFADLVQKYFFNGGALTPAKAAARFNARRDELASAIIAESARWGDAKQADNEPPRTKDDDWLPVINDINARFFPTRTAVVLEQFRDRGWYPELSGTKFLINGQAQHGGAIDPGDLLSITHTNGTGTIYFTLDGSDPRLPMFVDGANGPQAEVAPGAVAYAGAVPLNGTTRVRARVLNGTDWSALTEAVYAPADAQNSLRVTEIMYHAADAPTGNPEAEFVELQNTGNATINLAGVRFVAGITFAFPEMTLAPGAYVLVVSNEAAFTSFYGEGFPIAGTYAGLLDNGGERIELVDAVGTPISSFRYNDTWYGVTDGLGHSLSFIDPSLDPLVDWSLSGNWKASSLSGGSPGEGDTGNEPEANSIVINELLAHSDNEAADWIELHNTSASAIDISGWYLSDDALALQKYEFPEGSIVPAQGFLVVSEHLDFNSAGNPAALIPFALSEGGEEVFLSSGSGGVLTGYRSQEDFGASRRGETWGRYTASDGQRFPILSAATPGAANAAPALGAVVITEIMYDPASNNQDEEYIELYNTTATAITLQGPGNVPWAITNGVEFNFPAGATIPAHGRVIVSANPTAFTAAYGNPGVTVFGPYGGRLSDGESVELSEPADRNVNEPQFYYRVDHVVYQNDVPWPLTPNGQGDSLQRVSTSAFSNDSANWTGAAPTPGE